MFPPSFRSDGHESERPAYLAFQRLPNPWRVFHSVAWIAPGNTATDGEADFVLVHPERGIFVFENKGGPVTIRYGQWVRTNSTGAAPLPKDPFKQATASKHQLLRFLKDRADLGFVRAGHGVVLPDVVVDGGLGPDAPRELIIDRRDLQNPEDAVQRVIDYWGGRHESIRTRSMDLMTQLLAPTLEVKPLLRDDVDAARARLIRLTDEQVKLLDLISGNRSFIAYGGAGSGKTVLAIEHAKRLERSTRQEDEGSVLLLCYNRLLGEHLEGLLSEHEGIHAGRFLSVCWRIAMESGYPMPLHPTSAWWDKELPAIAAEAFENGGRRFSAVIVDEGQDFHPDWWDYIRFMVGPDAPFYVFADPHQAIYRPGWRPPFDEPNFTLTTNCRNTLQIAEEVAAVFGDPVSTLGVEGPTVEFLEATTEQEIAKSLRGTLQRLLVGEQLRPDQVVVLCDRRHLVERLRDTEFANQRLVSPGMRGVVVESIHRFKGLESDSVIMIRTSDPDEDDRMLSYVGKSRARAHLVVIQPQAG